MPERPPLRRTASQSGRPGGVYDLRFGDAERSKQAAVWREIGRYLQGQFVPLDSKVLDIACDVGYLIGSLSASERWASDLRDTSARMPADVRFIQADGLQLAEVAPSDYFDVVFMSNYLEHLDSAESVIAQLGVVRRLLRPGGRLVVLQPNIRFVGAAYWDFIDHRVPLTAQSLVEAATIAGFETDRVVERFLPYSIKGRLPTHPLLVRAYLRFPPAWRLFGKQTLYVGRRPDNPA